MKTWQNKLKEVMIDRDNFGHNCKVDINRYLNRIEKLCADNGRTDGIVFCDIEIEDEYTVKITLPEDDGDLGRMRNNVLLHILTTDPMPSECRFNKKKDQLTIEWHY